MLNLENLRNRVRGSGFTPFTLHLTDGRALPVPHPEYVAVSRNIVVVVTEDGVSFSIDPLHIVAISDKSAVPSAS